MKQEPLGNSHLKCLSVKKKKNNCIWNWNATSEELRFLSFQIFTDSRINAHIGSDLLTNTFELSLFSISIKAYFLT